MAAGAVSPSCYSDARAFSLALARYNAIPGMLPQEMSAVFKAVDDNASGFISRREWMELFGQNSKRRKVEVASGLSGGYA